MADYNNTHRALLQVFMARGTLTYETTKPILASILTVSDPSRETMPNDITQQDFTSYIHTLNNAISPFDLEIRSSIPQSPTLDPDTPAPDRTYALVNMTSDPITQLATTHSADEIAFLKRVLDHMFESNTRKSEVFAILSRTALTLHKPPATQEEVRTSSSFTQKDAEKTLESLHDEGWLERSNKGYYRLSARALMELRNWLVETYNDDEEERVRFCHGCREIVIAGQRCANWDCGVRVHDFCARNMLRAAGGHICPGCKTAWTGEVPVGEKAAKHYGRPSGVGQGRRSSGAVTNRVVDDDDDEE
ncbi:Nse1 non-SMC component of SMC5-6 complex-domain-containing protein [Elsinoe ampelina]|uniref:Non-structural maintenance of chromosomes element 1 homolog n=1 Tax=Elsinoe ampelina TaxID=302913 RepID=A0A6A6GIV5_9PEZI|nr:Nse1 non-SMC component of SMC5-6 complex-domain-containing protein [Elsinoe ampelina]